MSKNIVILNGSPRKNGNASALVRAFTGGAESAGQPVVLLDYERSDQDSNRPLNKDTRRHMQKIKKVLKGRKEQEKTT